MPFTSRNYNITTIEYYIITTKSNSGLLDYYVPPEEFNSEIIEILKVAPLDFLQVFNSDVFFKSKCNSINYASLNINVIYTTYLENYNSIFSTSNNIKLLIFSKSINKINNNFFESLLKNPNIYFTIDKENTNSISENKYIFYNNYIDSIDSFIHKIRKDKYKIINNFNIPKDYYDDFINNFENLKTTSSIDNLEKIPIFKGAHQNFFVKNQINSNIWKNSQNIYHSQEYVEKEQSDFLLKKNNTIKDNLRQKVVLEQLKEIDFLHKKATIPVKVSDIEQELKPLIITLPYHNPQINKVHSQFGAKYPSFFGKYIEIEQDLNYLYNFSTEKDVSTQKNILFFSGQNYLQPRIQFLDFISYLHSTFTFSPILRLPFIGKSINKELSFLKPNTKNTLTGFKLIKTTYRLGNKLNKLTLTTDAEKQIMNRNSQIVAITDLPIELLSIKGLPLSLSHDIARIPETTFKSQVFSYCFNNFIQYSIPPNIKEKTLVIFSASKADNYFHKSWSVISNECHKRNIKAVESHSTEEVITTIKEFNPELLIIDCHGGYDEKTLSSYLLINNQKLTALEIKKYDIQVPLVFLSACTTNPIYGYVNSIANALIKNGSFSVTSTFLPISIDNGSLTYLRLLIHLESVAKNGDFPNWLSYVSHITRTAVFSNLLIDFEKKIAKQNKVKNINNDKFYQLIDKLKDSTIPFTTRRDTFQKVDKYLQNINSEIKLNFQAIQNESLLYTNIGRGDLVMFESWKKRKDFLISKYINSENE